jgi:photosystem II stability/assembly factor-like uncharacterized protein
MVDNLLFVASESGLAVAGRQGGEWAVRGRSLEGQAATSLAASGRKVLASTRDGIYRSPDLGRTWAEANAGLAIRHVRWLEAHPQGDGRVYAGTEPAGIFVSHDFGESWRSCTEVEAMRDRFGWSLPYSPQAGCVRGLAFHGQRGYAAVEDGCVLVSQDAGETWDLAQGSRGYPDHAPQPGFVHSDVHSIAVHPASPERVAAPTGGGFFLSQDGGKSWTDLYRYHYSRAVWLDPADPDHMVLGPADGVDRNGRIEQTRDGGRTWQAASSGLPVPWPRHMVERFAQAGEELLAVLSNGELYAAGLPDLAWRRILPEVKGIHAVVFIQVEV